MEKETNTSGIVGSKEIPASPTDNWHDGQTSFEKKIAESFEHAGHEDAPVNREGWMDEIRSVTSDKPLTRLFGNLALEAVKGVPVVGGFTDAVSALVKGIADIESQEREHRVRSYILGVAHGDLYNEKVEFREQDVIPVMRKLAADDETSKTEYYTRLTLKLGRTPLSELPSDLRYHFIRLVSSLTCYQIEFARRLKICQAIPLLGSSSSEEAELALTGQDSGMAMQAVRTLQNAGLLKEKESPGTWKGSAGKPLYDTTSDFDTLMELLFHPGDFEPEAAGLERKKVSDVIIVGARVFINDLYATYLPDALRSKGLKVIVVSNTNEHLLTDWAPLYLHTNILDDSHKRWIELKLTREGTRPVVNQTVNYIHCKFEERVYGKQKTKNQQEVTYFCKEMDRVVSVILAKIIELKSPARTQ